MDNNNNKYDYKFLFKNEEKRTTIIKEMEKYLNENLQGIEKHWKETGEIEKSPKKFNDYSQNVLQELKKLNEELRIFSNLRKESFKKDANTLLNLESQNYKISLGIFINKLNCFDMLKNDDDEFKLLKKEKEISLLRQTLADVREEINDFITNLKYKYLY